MTCDQALDFTHDATKHLPRYRRLTGKTRSRRQNATDSVTHPCEDGPSAGRALRIRTRWERPLASQGWTEVQAGGYNPWLCSRRVEGLSLLHIAAHFVV